MPQVADPRSPLDAVPAAAAPSFAPSSSSSRYLAPGGGDSELGPALVTPVLRPEPGGALPPPPGPGVEPGWRPSWQEAEDRRSYYLYGPQGGYEPGRLVL